MLEKNDLIQLKARTLERLQEVNVEDYTHPANERSEG